MSFYDVIARLKAAGLMSIPGGGAEILSDAIAQGGAGLSQGARPRSGSTSCAQAHRNGLRTSATMMYGMGEPIAARVEHFQRVRDLQDETGGFTAFISWTFQHDHTDMPDVPETYAEEYLRTLAVSRLFLDNIVHFQTSWVTQGKKIGQAALGFGADDMGSIMIEENVVASAGTAYRMSQDEMEHLHHLGRLHPEAADQPLRASGHPRGHGRDGAAVPPLPDAAEPGPGLLGAAAGRRVELTPRGCRASAAARPRGRPPARCAGGSPRHPPPSPPGTRGCRARRRR